MLCQFLGVKKYIENDEKKPYLLFKEAPLYTSFLLGRNHKFYKKIISTNTNQRIRQKALSGVLSIEASIAMIFFVGAFMVGLFFLNAVAQQFVWQRELEQTLLPIAVASNETKKEDFKKEDNYIIFQDIKGYTYPFDFFGTKQIWMQQSCYLRKWVGYDSREDETDLLVYITEEGIAYHKEITCNYLDLSIQKVPYESCHKLRNHKGSKYYSCEKCGKKNKKSDYVYLTLYGTKYHRSLSCSSLTRTIKRVPLSQVNGRGPCHKCYLKQ